MTLIGLIGLGNMGKQFGLNLLSANHQVIVYDKSPEAKEVLVKQGAIPAESVNELGEKATIIVSMLPNDAILCSVVIGGGEADDDKEDNSRAAGGLLDSLQPGSLHISCSTVSPNTSRKLADLHRQRGAAFVGAPVFARPDGVARSQAYFVVGGEREAVERVRPILQSMGAAQIYAFGTKQNDAGAGNVVKLCGNFLIASSIEAISESLALAESNGLDREEVMNMLSSTIFDCLIYRGYGQRVSKRDHQPGGFSLALGCKDVNLVKQTAEASGLDREGDMPLARLLCDRFGAACQIDEGKNQGLDWSAVASVSPPAATAASQKEEGEGNSNR